MNFDCLWNRWAQVFSRAFSKENRPWNYVQMRNFSENAFTYGILFTNCAIFYKLSDFLWIVRSDAIWGQLCEIAPSRNIRGPVYGKLSGKLFQHFSSIVKIRGVKYQLLLITAWTVRCLFLLVTKNPINSSILISLSAIYYHLMPDDDFDFTI